MIFVERITTAKAVERFMRGNVNFSRFSISYLTGGSTSKDALSPAVQRFTLDLFRAGKVLYFASAIWLEYSNDILTFMSIYRWICFLQQMSLKRVLMYLTVPVWYVLTYPELFVAMSSLVGVPEKAVQVMFLWLKGKTLPHLINFFFDMGCLAIKKFIWSPIFSPFLSYTCS
jgi:hypothetical protein